MINELKLKEFVGPYYRDKDIMHDLSHIERVINTVNKLAKNYPNSFDSEVVMYATYFHGFIYKDEDDIQKWLLEIGISEIQTKNIITVAWDSQKEGIPKTLEGKILHDAHMIEGGKTYLIVKSLITGSVRGQTLKQTIEFIERNILDKGECYLPEAKKIYKEQQLFAKVFLSDLKEGLE